MINSFYILAGGKSTRMGQNKAFLNVSGTSVIEKILTAIPTEPENICIVTNSPAEFAELPVRLISDVHPGFGPISGIHAGLSDSTDKFNFFTACDLPFLTSTIVKRLLKSHKGQDVFTVRTSRGFEPLFAVYSKMCLTEIEKQINAKDYSMYRLFDKIPPGFIELKKSQELFNMNTNEDYLFVKNSYEKRKSETKK